MAKQKSEIETLRTMLKDLDTLTSEEVQRVLKYAAEKHGFDLVTKAVEKK